MDPKLKAIINLIQSKRKSSFPWTRQIPYQQPIYSYSAKNKKWQSMTPNTAATTSQSPVPNISILSWNIDFMLIHPSDRMTSALNHLKKQTTNSSPNIIMLQECLTTDLSVIQSTPWIQSSYNITDIDDTHWESGHYGTCTLISKSLPITSAFRVHYTATKMERDALFVDIDVGFDKPLRICNTHLESLVADPPLRPAQVETASKFMLESTVLGSILGGDLNAIQPFDRTLHENNGLKDAYLALGGKEDSEEGYTWGQMAPIKQREMFGCSRMDKLFFCGDIEVTNFERFGLGVELEGEEKKKELKEDAGMDGGWVTDHLGVMGDFKIATSSALGSHL